MATIHETPEPVETPRAGLEIFKIPARVENGQTYPPALQFKIAAGRQRYQLDAARYLPMFAAAKSAGNLAALKAVGRGVPDVIFAMLHPDELAELALAYEAWAKTAGKITETANR